MSSSENFRLLALLFGVLERIATPGRVKSLLFRDASGQVIGGLTLEGGLVRVGVQVDERPYVDDTFKRELPAHIPQLTKLLHRECLTEADVSRLQNVPLLVRRALRAVTARALRKLSMRADLSQLGVSPLYGRRDKPLGALNYMFPLVELMLAAGSSGSIRYTDIAARAYETPPTLVLERWIFEWQAEDEDCPWPVMTHSMAERQTNAVAQFGQLGQELARHLRLTQRGSRMPLLQLAATDEHAYYVISTERYVTLLVYQSAQLERLLQSMQELATSFADSVKMALPTLSTPSVPQPAEISGATATPVAARPPAPKALSATPESVEIEAMLWLQAAAELAVDTAPAALPSSAAPLSPAAPVSRECFEFPDPVLALRSFTAVMDERTILKGLSFEIGRHGVYALMGPGGSGKSSLLGILSGRLRSASGWNLSGTIVYDGAALGTAARPAVIGQKLGRPAIRLSDFLLGDLDEAEAASFPADQLVELLERVYLSELAGHLDQTLGGNKLSLSASQWWRLAIARELLTEPALLCVDEPTAGLDEAEAAPILSVLKAEGRRRAILFVTHQQQHARACSDHVILLAGGRVQEYQPVDSFFTNPQTRAAKDYVRTGGCVTPAPDTRAEQLETEFADLLPAPASFAKVDSSAAASASAEAAMETASAMTLTSAEVNSADFAADDHVLWAAAAEFPAVLRLRNFGLKLGTRDVLTRVNLDISERGMHLLVGPDGTERRLLLRALGGLRSDSFEISGQALYLGRALTDGEGPGMRQTEARLAIMPAYEYLVSNFRERNSRSRAELLTQAKDSVEQAGYSELLHRFDVAMCDLETEEQRVLQILRATASSPALLVLDEPLHGLFDKARARLRRLLEAQAAARALLLFVQDSSPFFDAECKSKLVIAWFSDGRITDTPAPSQTPHDAASAGADDVQQASAPLPFQTPSTESPERVEAAAAVAPHAGLGVGPRGFRWLRHRALAGMPAPGLSNDLHYDLELVRGAGITYLITLIEEPIPSGVLGQFELRSLHFPIADMDAPTPAAAAVLCEQIEGLLSQGFAVAVHCKAGLGRTGTMLAAQLIWEGADADSALTQVRTVEPGWVQSNKQVQFLQEFSRWLSVHVPFSNNQKRRTIS